VCIGIYFILYFYFHIIYLVRQEYKMLWVLIRSQEYVDKAFILFIFCLVFPAFIFSCKWKCHLCRYLDYKNVAATATKFVASFPPPNMDPFHENFSVSRESLTYWITEKKILKNRSQIWRKSIFRRQHVFPVDEWCRLLNFDPVAKFLKLKI
jgi:hypothetical protein